MRGTPSFRGSLSKTALEGSHAIVSSFSVTDSSHNELFMVNPTSVTFSVNFNELSPDVCNYLKSVNSNVQNQLNTCLKVQESTIL